jgi:hypothetical protein
MCCIPNCLFADIDEVLRKIIERKKRSMTWRTNEHLESLVFAEYVYLLSHTFSDMQENIKYIE